jgi:DNA-binding NarL/FixJ family response regulator
VDYEERVAEDGHQAGPVRVLVVDDDEHSREALAAVVSTGEEFTLAGCAESGGEALQLLPDVDPHLVLLDVRMPELGGPETARRMLESRPDVVVVLVSAEPDLHPLAAACGAAAFVPKREMCPTRLREVWAETRARAAQARREAHALHDEARAVQAQAAHQVRRALKNVGPPKSDDA